MASSPVRPWGNDRADTANTGPQFGYLANEPQLTGGATANVQPTSSGWVLELPWAAETLVAMGGLGMPAPVVNFVRDQSGAVANAAAQNLAVLVQLSKGVTVGANTANVFLTAVSSDANVANVNLVLSASDSNPAAGVLVFKAANTDFSTYANGTTLTMNSSTVFHGNTDLLSRRAKTAQPMAGALVGNVVISILA
jgi:hypothetical protein